MLRELLSGGITPEALIQTGLYIIIILISLSVHELFHGYVAYRCGDATARNMGRLTLNPLAHLDPIGTLMMLFFGFGYANPVPINTRNFNHYKRDLCFVSLAGPLSNLVLAIFGAVLCIVTFHISPDIFFENTTGGFSLWAMPEFFDSPLEMWVFFCTSFTWANVSLCIFNLLPIPPLDGSKIVSVILPGKIAYYYLKYERYMMIAVLALLYLNVLDGALVFLTGHLHYGIVWLIDLIVKPIISLF